MADVELVEPFVHAVLELLSFVMNATTATTHSSKVHTPSLPTPAPPHPRDSRDLHTLTASTQDDTPTSSAVCYLQPEEVSPVVWPPCTDPRLQQLITALQHTGGGVSESACRWHMCLLWVLQLRTQCGLRGVKTSELMGEVLLQSMCAPESLCVSWSDMYVHPPSASEGPGGSVTDQLAVSLRAVREEFMLQCFRRLESQSSNVVYAVTEQWGIDNKHARLTHLSTLLELGQDDIIGELISQVRVDVNGWVGGVSVWCVYVTPPNFLASHCSLMTLPRSPTGSHRAFAAALALVCVLWNVFLPAAHCWPHWIPWLMPGRERG